MRYIPALYIIVGLEGPNPEDPYGGYVRKICLPRRFYKIEDVSMVTYGEEDQLSAKHQLAVKGLSECKASKSNIICIQVKDIVKEVEDYLKTYPSAGMDISWYVEGIR
ncbi:hypothetical protein Tco_0722452 [Tanacetum coccineum]